MFISSLGASFPPQQSVELREFTVRFVGVCVHRQAVSKDRENVCC